jgi:hypothetical protein
MKIDKQRVIISLSIFDALNNQSINMKMSNIHCFFSICLKYLSVFTKVFKTIIYKFFVEIICEELNILISLSDKIIFL